MNFNAQNPIQNQPLNIDNDELITLNNVKNAQTGAYVTTGTMLFGIVGTSIGGTMTWTGTAGTWQGVLLAAWMGTLVVGTNYVVSVAYYNAAPVGTPNANWSFNCIAQTRGQY
jgi:hypothetical protein